MNQQKIFEALRLKLKLSKIISDDKVVTSTKKDIIGTVKSYSDLLIEFENTGDEIEFKYTLIDLCSSVIEMLDGFSAEQKRSKTLQEMLQETNFEFPPYVPRYPNGGLVGPLSTPNLFKILNETGVPFNRKASVNEIEKQLKEAKDGLGKNGTGAKS